ncbi:MAG: DUF3426 domain-containing protein, partial [Candidatus Adiutrix sp.]
GVHSLTFSNNSHNHYFRKNVHGGQILIITGMVRNAYPERRSFIRLRGVILSADNAVLADRYIYAGNLISEDDLINLPVNEIIARLSIKGGQNGLNMNIDPGKDVPFMIVFNNLPDGMAGYEVEPVGSSSGD